MVLIAFVDRFADQRDLGLCRTDFDLVTVGVLNQLSAADKRLRKLNRDRVLTSILLELGRTGVYPFRDANAVELDGTGAAWARSRRSYDTATSRIHKSLPATLDRSRRKTVRRSRELFADGGYGTMPRHTTYSFSQSRAVRKD